MEGFGGDETRIGSAHTARALQSKNQREICTHDASTPPCADGSIACAAERDHTVCSTLRREVAPSPEPDGAQKLFTGLSGLETPGSRSGPS